MKKFGNFWIKFYFLWVIFTIIIPIIMILHNSLINPLNFNMDLSNYERIFSPTYMIIFFNSFLFSFIITIICIILSYIISIIILKIKNITYKNIVLLLFIIPIFTNIIMRIYSWMNLFYKGGFIDRIFNIYNINICYSNFEVYSGMIYNFFPFMFLPIYTSLSTINENILNSAKDLGANDIKIFKKILLPLSKEGLITGINMVFFPSITLFIVPNILSAGKYNLIGNVIERQFTVLDNINFGCTIISILYLIIILLSIIVYFVKIIIKYFKKEY